MDPITTTNHPHTILLLGTCGSGKSSLINAITGTNECPVSADGAPKTKSLNVIPFANKIYIDTPGFCKNSLTAFQLPFPEQRPPSMIWLVVNFKAGIEDYEFEIPNAHPSIPTIIILNKVDKLTSEAEVENFNKPEYSTNKSQLAAIWKRLMNMKQSNSNIRHIVIMSLEDEEDDKRPPIGIGFLQKMTDLELGKQHVDITGSQLERSNVSIAVIGFSSSGKSSLVNAVLRESKAVIGVDGNVTTKDWTCYDVNQVHLWDGPGVKKRTAEQEQTIIPMESKIPWDIIWLILNYQSWDIEDVADLCSIFQIDSNIPVIIIINKVDILTKIPDLSERDLVEFSHNSFTSSKISTRTQLIERINSINDKFSQSINLKAITVMSLRSDDDDDDDESFKTIGVNALFVITRENLKNDNERFTFDMLKQSNVKQKTGQLLQTNNPFVFDWRGIIADWIDWFNMIRAWLPSFR